METTEGDRKRYVLTRDGVELARGTWVEVARHFYSRYPYSMEWAKKYEGFKIEYVDNLEARCK